MLDVKTRRRWERHDVTIAVNIETVVNGERSSFSGQASDKPRGRKPRDVPQRSGWATGYGDLKAGIRA